MATCDDASRIAPGLRQVDSCPVMDKLRAYVVQQGVRATLTWNMQDSSGNPIDLEPCINAKDSVDEQEELGSLDADEPRAEVVLRIRPITSGYPDVQIVPATIEDAATGAVSAKIPAAVADEAGIWQLSWGAYNELGELVVVNEALLSTERSLFGSDPVADKGPPTLLEIRTLMRDTAVENLWLGDTEYDTAEIILAISQPVEYWNEQPPPLRPRMTPANFPYRHHWLKAIKGQLMLIAADHYRRTNLPYQAGGISIADKNKEREYLMEGQRLLQEYYAFVAHKKVQKNAEGAYGVVGSSYSRRMWI